MNRKSTKKGIRASLQCPLGNTSGPQCPRCQAYERLPKQPLLQAFITFVMGVPHVGQTPIIQQTRTTRVITLFVVFYLSVLATGLGVVLATKVGLAAQLLLIPAIITSVLVTSGLARSMSMCIMHYASHGDFGRYSRLVGELASVVGMCLSYPEYKTKHLTGHHPLLTSNDDPDQQTIAAWKFTPGLPLNFYTKRFLRVMVSPRDFVMHLRARLASQFAKDLSFSRGLVVVSVQAMPLVIAIGSCLILGNLTPLLAWAIAWLLPLTYGTYLSMVLFSLGLHKWFMQRKAGMSARVFYLSKTGGRFFGDPLPQKDLPLLRRYFALSLWWLRLLVVHLLIGKLFVMGASDNQQHDAHHIDPQGKKHEWFNSIYSRHLIASSGQDASYVWNTWGSVLTAVRLNFERMAKMPKVESDTVLEPENQNVLRNDM